MSMKPLLLAALCASLVAGCGQSTVVHDSVLPVAASPTYAPITPAEACPAAKAEHLPADYDELPKAYVCRQEERKVPGDGEWTFDVAFGVTSGLPELIEAYKAPDEKTPPNVACALVMYVLPVVYLHGQRLISAAAPKGQCSGPTPEAGKAYGALGLTELGATKNRRQRSELSLSSGCSDQYKDMIALEEEMGGPTRSAAKPGQLVGATHVCIYDVVPDSDGDRIGQLSLARSLSAAELNQVNSALEASTKDPTCSRHEHKQFALLWSPPNGSYTLVAVDGCAVQQDGGWWRGTDRLRELVAAG
jgi:hypothetical protein